MSASSDDSEYKVRGRKASPSQTPKGRATRQSPDKQPSISRANGRFVSTTDGGTSSRDPEDDSGVEQVDDSGETTSRSATAKSPELGLSPSLADTRHASSSLSEHSSKSPTPPSVPQPSSRSRQPVEVPQRQTASTSTSPLQSDEDPKPKKRGFSAKKRPAVSSSDESDTTQVPTPKPRKVGRPRAQPKHIAPPSRLTSGEDVDPVENGSSANKSGDEDSNGSGSEEDAPARVTAQAKPARGRGRPRGRRSFPASRAVPRSAASSAPTSKTKSTSASASASEMIAAYGGGGVRATRATVTLPAGYIEGVKSTRMTKARSESVPAQTEVVEEEEEVVEVKGKKNGKGKGKGKEKREEDQKEEEEKVEEKPTFEPERTTFSKRRKVDTGAAERAAERAAVRLSLLDQLDQEAERVESGTHPLIGRTCERLAEEKARRLANLARCREERELELERHLAAETEAIWRQWADAKDVLRMDLYLANHDQLKQLIYEEKAYPFLRDHPLLVSSHNLPPVPYFRAPLSPTLAATYPPRSKILSSEYLEPPPVNPALDHSVWELSSSEIADDLAIFADFAALPPPPPSLPQHAPIPGYHYPLYAPNHPAGSTTFHPPPPPLAAAPPHSHFYSKPAEAASPDHRLFPSPSTTKPVPATRMNFDIPPRTNFDSTKPVPHPNPYSAFGLPSIASLDAPRRPPGPLDVAPKYGGGAGTSLLPAFAPSHVDCRVAATATTGWHPLGAAAAPKAAAPVGVPAAWGAPTTAPVAPRVVPYQAKAPPAYQYWG